MRETETETETEFRCTLFENYIILDIHCYNAYYIEMWWYIARRIFWLRTINLICSPLIYYSPVIWFQAFIFIGQRGKYMVTQPGDYRRSGSDRQEKKTKKTGSESLKKNWILIRTWVIIITLQYFCLISTAKKISICDEFWILVFRLKPDPYPIKTRIRISNPGQVRAFNTYHERRRINWSKTGRERKQSL